MLRGWARSPWARLLITLGARACRFLLGCVVIVAPRAATQEHGGGGRRRVQPHRFPRQQRRSCRHVCRGPQRRSRVRSLLWEGRRDRARCCVSRACTRIYFGSIRCWCRCRCRCRCVCVCACVHVCACVCMCVVGCGVCVCGCVCDLDLEIGAGFAVFERALDRATTSACLSF